MPSAAPDLDAPLETTHPFWDMVKLAAPTVATMLSYTAMQFTDAFMVSRIDPPDPVHLAAQGNGGIWAFVPASMALGFVGVVNTYVSQNLGAGHPERGPAYAWNALWLGLLAWVGLMLPMAVLLPHVFAHMGHEPRLLELETAYGRILLCGLILTVCTRAMSQFFYGLHKPGIVFTAAVVGNLANLFLNYLLIYGHWGLPKMGVNGAATATVIATGIELCLPLGLFLSRGYHERYGTRTAWRPSLPHVKDLFRLGWAPALMFGNEIICWAIFMSSYAGRFGAAQNSASWIALRYMHLSFMPAVGISYACTAMVGRALGANRPDLAAARARQGVLLAMAYMGVCALAFVLFRHPMIDLFMPEGTPPDQRAAILHVGTRIMIVAAVFQLFDGLGITLVGVLRGAGDTVWPGLLTIVLAWTCIVGGGWVVAEAWPAGGALGPWIAAGAYIILLGLGLFYRFASGKWREVHLLKHSAAG
ncbi:MAG: MATE family efflux transporter [Phycisphaerales bacterium]